MFIKKIIKGFSLLTLLTVANSCAYNLHSGPLAVAVLNEAYNESFYISDDDNFFSNYFTEMTDGDLPDGIGITSNGRIVGAPTEVGAFDFEVSIYSYDQDFFGDFDDGGFDDSEWFTLFVTENSTNADCPSPSTEGLTEFYLCLGDLTEDSLREGDELSLDVNMYVNLDDAFGYDLTAMDFTIFYDADSFTLDDTDLNSQILREAANQFGATITFDNTIPGQLGVVLTATAENFRVPGRLMNIPFSAKVDLPADTFDFTVTVNSLTSASGASLPSIVEINGSVETQDSEVEETPQETTPEAS